MLQDTIYATVFSVIAGGILTWIAAWWYYKKAGNELLKETALLRKANMAVIYMLEHPDAEIEVQRDAEGNPVGLIVSATGHARATSAARGVGADASREP